MSLLVPLGGSQEGENGGPPHVALEPKKPTACCVLLIPNAHCACPAATALTAAMCEQEPTRLPLPRHQCADLGKMLVGGPRATEGTQGSTVGEYWKRAIMRFSTA